MAAASLGPVIAPTALVAVISSTTAVVINFATSDGATVWTWVVVGAMTVFGFLASLWLQHRVQDASSQPGTVIQVRDTVGDVKISLRGVVHADRPQPLAIMLILAVLAPLLVYATVGSMRSEAAGPPPTPNEPQVTCAKPVPTPGPDGLIRTHEIWASSADNQRHPINEYHDWVMTSFPVRVPYLTSIDVAAGPNGRKVLITVENGAEGEIAQGEAIVADYRAKYTFVTPVDVSRYLCRDPYLRVRNITDLESHVYLSRTDRDPGVYTYFSDQCRTLTDPATACQNKDGGGQDLSALVAGRTSP